ncbi:response regulator transcription factor [Geopsychrobacter electrodiphilus]|uniref:response regulator transcription factor n=1 Tax=Geopsychrobacter electrodiphilus TaxID=225196 RepID=UPI00035F66C6|nr:response regulator transcription factor [Geopsychrobacter electrodiphilus]
MSILVIEDDIAVGSLLLEFLQPEGFSVEVVQDGVTGLERSLSGEHRIVILDVKLPGLNGFEVLHRIRAESDIPILMLTVYSKDEQRIRGLELGADDYLPKPFNPRELLARIHNILRRSQQSPSALKQTDRLQVGDILLDLGSHRAYRSGENIQLTAAEFSLLEILLSRAGHVVPREELVHHVQGRQNNPYDRSIDVHISHLRKKLSCHPDGSERIKSVRGVGHFYSLPADNLAD